MPEVVSLERFVAWYSTNLFSPILKSMSWGASNDQFILSFTSALNWSLISWSRVIVEMFSEKLVVPPYPVTRQNKL